MSVWDETDPFARARNERGVLDIDFEGERIPLVLRFDDVRAAALNPHTYSSDAPFRVPIPSEEKVRSVRQLPIETDPPEHTEYRAIVQPFFNRAKQRETIERIEKLVAQSISDAGSRSEVEVVQELALPLQSRALAVLLNMPADDAERWIGWGTHVFRAERGLSETKGSRLDRYVNEQLDRAEEQPGNDFFSALVKARFRGRPLTREEMSGFAVLTFAGGRDTVINMLSFTLAYLAEHPDECARMRGDAMRVRRAVEEFVRFVSPLTHIGRVCPHATEVFGTKVLANERVSLCWASANRDDAVFESPNEVDIDRARNPHLGFGAGPHLCLGVWHARLLLRTVIAYVCDKNLSLEIVDGQPLYEQWPGYRRQTGFHSLTLRFRSAGHQ